MVLGHPLEVASVQGVEPLQQAVEWLAPAAQPLELEADSSPVESRRVVVPLVLKLVPVPGRQPLVEGLQQPLQDWGLKGLQLPVVLAFLLEPASGLASPPVPVP